MVNTQHNENLLVVFTVMDYNVNSYGTFLYNG
jgi:hypothetical protein